MKEYCCADINAILLGNKADLKDLRQVDEKEAIALALKYKFEYKESSCYENKNVAGAFEALVEGWNVQNKRNEREEKQSSHKKKRQKVL